MARLQINLTCLRIGYWKVLKGLRVCRNWCSPIDRSKVQKTCQWKGCKEYMERLVSSGISRDVFPYNQPYSRDMCSCGQCCHGARTRKDGVLTQLSDAPVEVFLSLDKQPKPNTHCYKALRRASRKASISAANAAIPAFFSPPL
jgi:hypothetical protein